MAHAPLATTVSSGGEGPECGAGSWTSLAAAPLWQIAPWCAGSQHPAYAVEDTSIVHTRHASRLVRQHRANGTSPRGLEKNLPQCLVAGIALAYTRQDYSISTSPGRERLTEAEIDKLLAGLGLLVAQPDRINRNACAWVRPPCGHVARDDRRRHDGSALSRHSLRPVASGQHLSAITKHDQSPGKLLDAGSID